MTAIAVLGTGHMGTPIARRLLATGHRVRVWNRTKARAAPLAAAGADIAMSPGEAVRDADVVITMLTDGDAVQTVLFGPGGAAADLAGTACVIQMSTIGSAGIQDVARRLPDGVELVDAPVAGSVSAAGTGRLVVLVGGTDAAADRAAPILQTLGTVRRCGGLGAATAVKLVLNTALVTAVAALADTLAVADAVGVAREVALDALAAGALGGAVTRVTDGGSSFAIALAAKDLDLARRELAGFRAAVADAAAELLHCATDPTADISALIQPR
jgi:3-hydroxyisobutyrate dehydrogenase-like beta-hydroxyacid dehydrogenase